MTCSDSYFSRDFQWLPPPATIHFIVASACRLKIFISFIFAFRLLSRLVSMMAMPSLVPLNSRGTLSAAHDAVILWLTFKKQLSREYAKCIKAKINEWSHFDWHALIRREDFIRQNSVIEFLYWASRSFTMLSSWFSFTIGRRKSRPAFIMRRDFDEGHRKTRRFYRYWDFSLTTCLYRHRCSM